MLNKRALIFGLLAVMLGITGAYTNFKWIESQRPATVTETIEVAARTVDVVIARTDLGAGKVVRDLELTTVAWPEDLVPEGAFVDLDAVTDRVPRRVIAQGEPVLASALFAEGSEAGLSPMIASGHRAVAVKVDDVIGIAGFVKPGARVDVLATIRTRGQSRDSFANVILQDVKVLAADQTLEETTSAGAPKSVNVVTLEVTPRQAEKLTFAAHEGKLQLALRNPGDDATVNTYSVNATSLQKRAPKKTRKTRKVEVIKGLELSKRNF